MCENKHSIDHLQNIAFAKKSRLWYRFLALGLHITKIRPEKCIYNPEVRRNAHSSHCFPLEKQSTLDGNTSHMSPASSDSGWTKTAERKELNFLPTRHSPSIPVSDTEVWGRRYNNSILKFGCRKAKY
jgi:hypothetical protein